MIACCQKSHYDVAMTLRGFTVFSCIASLMGCASTSSQVRNQLEKKSLMGRWQVVNQPNGWLDISCEGEFNLKTPDVVIEEGVITEVGDKHFISEPNPFNDQFNYKVLTNKNTQAKQQVITVHAVPDSNILKVVQAFSALVGDDNTIVFKKVSNYECL